jgi:hypothetical protein
MPIQFPKLKNFPFFTVMDELEMEKEKHLEDELFEI